MTHALRRARRPAGARVLLAALVILSAAWMRTPAPATRAGEAAQGQPRTHAVPIRNFAYEPAELAVAVGDTVVFTNEDVFTHTATEDGKAWDSGSIAPKRSWRMVVAGPASYHCSFHPSMQDRWSSAEPGAASAIRAPRRPS